MKIRIKKIHERAKMPTYATPGSACFDLYSVFCTYGGILGAQTETHMTGLQFEIPTGHVMLIFSRSGHGFNNGVRLVNCVGVIDSDYRGDVVVKLRKDDSSANPPDTSPGARIAQALILPIERVQFDLVDSLTETARGEGGFGSTGE